VNAYLVEIRPRADRAVNSLNSRVREAVLLKAYALGRDPRPHGSLKLHGAPARYRIRVGDYRIVYAIDDESRTVTVLDVGHRSQVYR